MRLWRGHSLRWRLSALVSVLITAAIATSLVATYSAVKQVLLRVGGERAVGATGQLATLLSSGNRQRLADLHREASNAAYAACLADPSDPNRALVETRLRSLATAGQQVIELWTAAGTRVVTVASPAGAATALPDGEPPGQGGIRFAETAAHVVVSESIEPVGGGSASRAGFILIRRAVSTSANNDALGKLVGDGARILLGSADGGPWTDLSGLVPAPPLDQPRGASFAWRTTSGEWRLGAVAAVPGTPWLVSVDFPRAAVLRPLWSFVRDISLVGLLFVVLSVVVGRVTMGRVIGPLEALTKASETIASGDYSARVAEDRTDELGRLGSAFNAMTSEVEAGRARLEARVRERTDALEALRHSEARHRAIVSVAFDSIITIDLSGRVTEFNPTAERTFGYARSEALGRELADLIVPPQHREAHRTGLARYAATGHGPMIGRLLELTAMRSDGSEFPIEFAIQPVQIEGQTSFTAYLRDLTERRRADELRLRSLHLEAENTQVREASRMKSEFLANMSHELRTPLNAIIGFSDMLRHESRLMLDADRRVEYAGFVLTSGRHLLQLINDVLDLSKVEAGKLEFRPEPIEVERIVREVLSVLKEAAASKGLSISVDVEPLTDVYLDAGRLKQVLYNYVSNALKFTPSAGRVAIRARAEGPDAWRLEVEDSGIGIAEKDLPRLFVEFEQMDAGAAKQHAGTGLGLALTKRLVEAQGGHVGARSTLGVGSVFWATLPLVHTGPAERNYPVLTTGGHGPAILVIEDDPQDRAELVDALTAAGFSVEAVATGADAVRRAEERAFAAITLDLLLPDQSGLDVLRQIRERGRNPDARVVVVTVVAERHALAGHLVTDLLPKPMDAGVLLASLRRAGVVPGKEVRIIVIDDDEAAVRLAQTVLEGEGFSVDGHTDPAAGLAAAVARRPSAIVLDLLMPGMNGFQFLDELRRTQNNHTTPVVVWTSKELSEAEQQRLTASARAVVHKGSGAPGLVAELQAMLAPVE